MLLMITVLIISFLEDECPDCLLIFLPRAQELSLALCLSTAEVINSGILAFNTSQQVQFSFMAIDMFEKLIVSVLKVNLSLSSYAMF